MSVSGMTGGDQKPLLKFNAKSGKWQIDDKVVDRLTMLVDLDHAEAGWAWFGEGMAPDFRMVPMASLVAGGTYPPMPADADAKGKPLFKRAFRLMTKISDRLAGGKPSVREFTSCSLATVRAVDKLHTAWLAARQDGKIPVVSVTGYRESPGQFGSNYEPIFEITKWIDRPEGFTFDATTRPPPEPPSHVTDPIGEPEAFDDDADENPWS